MNPAAKARGAWRAFTAAAAVLLLCLLAGAAGIAGDGGDRWLLWSWVALFALPAWVFAGVVGARRATFPMGILAVAAARPALPWITALALLQIQAWGAIWDAVEYVQFWEGTADTLDVVRASLVRLASASPYAEFKLLLFVPLIAWDFGWLSLAVRESTPPSAPGAAHETGGLVRGGILGGAIALFAAHVMVFLPGLIFSSSDEFEPRVTGEALIARHAACRSDCERLRVMIQEDQRIATVGLRAIGEWQGGRHGWKSGGRRTADLAVVLADVGLTEARHQEYLQLLDRVGGDEVRVVDHDCEIRVSYEAMFHMRRDAAFTWFASGAPPPTREDTWFTPLTGGWFLRRRSD